MGPIDNTDGDEQTATQSETESSHVCDLSLDEHIEIALSGLTLMGLGMACGTEYQALLVIAEASRQLHEHPAYDPTPKATEMADKVRAMRAARLAKQEQAQEAADRFGVSVTTLDEGVFPAADNGIVH